MSARRSLVGLIGANIMGSLSPALHEDAFAAAGIHGYYHLMDLDRLPGRRLEDLLGAVKAAGFDGVNVTFPCKQAVMPLLDEMSPDAQQIGAVNSVTIAASGRTTGYNTDRSGFRGNFEEGLGRGCVEGKTAVLVGAGGAGRAVAFALMDLGAATVLVHDTDMGRATSLVADLAAAQGSLARTACRLAGRCHRGRCRRRQRHADRHVGLSGQSGADRGAADRTTGWPTSSTRRSRPS